LIFLALFGWYFTLNSLIYQALFAFSGDPNWFHNMQNYQNRTLGLFRQLRYYHEKWGFSRFRGVLET